MSEEFLGGKTDSLQLEFVERRKFLEFLRSSEIEVAYPFLDTLYREKLYGKIDDSGKIIIPTPETKRFGQYAAGVTGLNYIVDLFNNFRNFYLSTDSFKEPEKLLGLIPKKNFVNFEQQYQTYETKIVNKILPILIEYFQSESVFYYSDQINRLQVVCLTLVIF